VRPYYDSPANHPVPGLPLSAVSHFCTFAQEHRSDLHLYTVICVPMSPCPRAPSDAALPRQNGVSSAQPTRILPLGRRVKCIVRCGPSLSGFTVI
jgi:hypothetical protein